MSGTDILIGVLAAIALFIYALQGFSKELEQKGGERLRQLLGQATASPLLGYAMGAGITALLQSSSAVGALTVALIDAGTITLRGSLPVFLGTNVGTTATAFLISFDLGSLGSWLIVAGAAASVAGGRWALAGKAVFYCGLVLFSLHLLSDALKPIKDHAMVGVVLSYASTPILGILIGAMVTAVVQSSSVTIGLTVLLAQQSIVPTSAILPIVIGANLGTTSTALIASYGLSRTARNAALANLFFNAAAGLALLPLLWLISEPAGKIVDDPGLAVAVCHIGFNLAVSALGFLFMEKVITALPEQLQPQSSA